MVANAQVKAKFDAVSVVNSGCTFANNALAFVTFSLYQPMAFGFSINAYFASANNVCTKYFYTSTVGLDKSTPAFLASFKTRFCISILKSRLVANGLLFAKSKFSTILAI